MTPDKWDERARSLYDYAMSTDAADAKERISEALRAARDEGVGEAAKVAEDARQKHLRLTIAIRLSLDARAQHAAQADAATEIMDAIRALARPEGEKPPASAEAARCRTCGNPLPNFGAKTWNCPDCGPRTEGRP
jgi:rubrerythrin